MVQMLSIQTVCCMQHVSDGPLLEHLECSWQPHIQWPNSLSRWNIRPKTLAIQPDMAPETLVTSTAIAVGLSTLISLRCVGRKPLSAAALLAAVHCADIEFYLRMLVVELLAAWRRQRRLHQRPRSTPLDGSSEQPRALSRTAEWH